jgi:hypothetical protein
MDPLFREYCRALVLASMSEYNQVLYEERGMFPFSCCIPFAPDDLLSESYPRSSNVLRLHM